MVSRLRADMILTILIWELLLVWKKQMKCKNKILCQPSKFRLKSNLYLVLVAIGHNRMYVIILIMISDKKLKTLGHQLLK